MTVILPPLTATNVTHTRVTDFRNNVTWTSPALAVAFLGIERSVDGGAWSGLATMIGTATSYADTSTMPNHSYSYRVVSQGSSIAYSAASTTTYNTPAAPSDVAAVRTGANTVTVTFQNNALTDTSIAFQRATAVNGPWTSFYPISGTGLTSFTDSPGVGTFYYRVRAERDTLYGAWSAVSNPVPSLSAPAAPTPLTPVNGAVVSKMQLYLPLTWQHNPVDGSTQTGFRVRVSVNNGASWLPPTSVNSPASSWEYATSSVAVNTTVMWQVATKGAYTGANDNETYSPWSTVATFTLRQGPQVVITNPINNGDLVTGLPLPISWSYSDVSGTQRMATVWIRRSGVGEAMEIRRTVDGSSNTFALDAADMMPPNGALMISQRDAYSASGLQSSATRSFLTSYVEPEPPSITLDVDGRLGIVSAYMRVGDVPGSPATASMSLFRRLPGGDMLPIGTGLADGAAVTDRFAPTDMDFEYVAVATAASGAFATTTQAARIGAYHAAFVNFGDGYMDVAKLVTDIGQTSSIEHDRTVLQTSGDDKPLVFYGTNVTRKGSRSGTALWAVGAWPTDDDPSSLANLQALSRHTGDVVLRLPGEQAFMADVTVTIDQSSPVVRASFTWQEVRGHGGLAL
jgi:hypothetical protein